MRSIGNNGIERHSVGSRKSEKKSKQRGKVLEGLARNINRTISAISAIKIIVNIFGACLAGIQVSSLCPQESQIKYLFPPILAVLILFFAEILPKNIGILYLPSLQKHLAYPLCMLDSLMAPITKIPEWFAKKTPLHKNDTSKSDDEILLLANKGEKDGLLSTQERDLIANSLSLDDVCVSEIMTPRTVVMAFEDTSTVSQIFKKYRKSISQESPCTTTQSIISLG
ncbi:MAG: CNNM domain-containing protein [Bacilli bacterium]